MNFLAKNGIDIVLTSILSGAFNVEFWQEIIVACVVVLLNCIIFPLIKKLGKKLGATDSEIKESTDKLKDAVNNLDKKDEK